MNKEYKFIEQYNHDVNLGSQKTGRLTPEERKLYFKKLNSMPDDTRNYVSQLSSIFLEDDVYEQFKNDPSKIDALKQELASMGMMPEDLKLTLRYFNLAEIQKQPEE